jgi:hypothetical protein
MVLKSKQKFYMRICLELILSPWLYFQNYMKWQFGDSEKEISKNLARVPVVGNKLSVCVHEWGGFEGKRIKKIKNIEEFECGLDYQLDRFQNYKGKYELDLTVTVSDVHLLKNVVKNFNIIEVDNIGMDFSGYSSFYDTIWNKGNQYVILTNSSVNKISVDFIDDYLDFFKSDESIGMLGISFSSKMYQTFIKNNFNPHLQSFFLLTTTEVLNEIVLKNKGFPGKGINYKLELIRNGEIKLSRLALDLGYKLVCVLEDGTPHYFDKNSFKDNGRNSWGSFFGDYRLVLKNPNAISALKV